MQDLISRQDAIDALRDVENHGFNSYYQGLIKVHKMNADLSSAEPEIIHCKECKYGKQDEYGRWHCGDLGFQIGDEDGNGFCSDAERRTDDE